MATINPFTGKPFVTSATKTVTPTPAVTTKSITDIKPSTTAYNTASPSAAQPAPVSSYVAPAPTKSITDIKPNTTDYNASSPSVTQPVTPTQTQTTPVQANGEAPKGLAVGTVVKTAGGDYKITAVNADGTYQSTLISAQQQPVQQPVQQPTQQSTQPAQPQPQEFVDTTIQGYKDQYSQAEKANDYESMINAASSADQHRRSLGMAPVNESLIASLTTARQQKIETNLAPFKQKYAEAQVKGDYQGMIDAATSADQYRLSVGLPTENADHVNYLKTQLNTSIQYEDKQRTLEDKLMALMDSIGKNDTFNADATKSINDQYTNMANAAQIRQTNKLNEDVLSQNQLKTTEANRYADAVQQLEKLKSQQAQDFTNQRATVDNNRIIKTKSLQEQLAAIGNMFGGKNVTGQVALNTAAQNGMNSIQQSQNNFNTDMANQSASLNRDQTTSLNQIDERIALLKKNGSAESMAIANEMEANKSQALLDLMYKGDSRAMERLSLQVNATSDALNRATQNKEFAYNKSVKDQELAMNKDKYGLERQLQLLQIQQAQNALDPNSPDYQAKLLQLDKLRADINATNTQTKNDTTKTNYEVNKPYATSDNMTESQAKSGAYAETFNKLSTLSVPQALQALQNPAVQSQMKANGIDVKTMWDDVMKEAIRINTPGVFNYNDYYGIK